MSEVTQIVIFVFCIGAFYFSYRRDENLEIIKMVLVVQIVQMQLTNFKVYKESGCKDSDGLYNNY